MNKINEQTVIGIYIFNQVEVLDFAGPFEVFTTASRMNHRIHPDSKRLFNVITIAESLQSIHARGDLVLQPMYGFENHPPLDVLIVPGGIVTEELNRASVIQWIGECSKSAIITASVCTGAFLLAKANLLDGKQATTHWEDIPDLREMFPQVKVIENTRWIDTGKVVSSAGISAGIDMSLHLVKRLVSDDLAIKTARQMEFDWQESGILD